MPFHYAVMLFHSTFVLVLRVSDCPACSELLDGSVHFSSRIFCSHKMSTSHDSESSKLKGVKVVNVTGHSCHRH